MSESEFWCQLLEPQDELSHDHAFYSLSLHGMLGVKCRP